MVETAGKERLTAFVSTVVAIAILAAGLTAQQNQSPAKNDVVSMASDLRFQFEMAFRHDTRQRDTRLTALDGVMLAWQQSPQSADDRGLLQDWLQDAAARSLPGALESLPEQPKFSTATTPIAHETNKVPTGPVISPSTQPKTVAVETASTDAGEPVSHTTPAVVQNAEPTPVTPTPSDPIEEEMIALRQPQSINPNEQQLFGSSSRSESAPRPGLFQQPELAENLLASVSVTKTSEPGNIGVNLTELSARIAGYHEGLDEVETALLRLNSADLDAVTEQINRLDAMTRDYGFVQLYYDSLTPAERRSVSEPRSMKATLHEVERQLNRCEETLNGDYLGSFDKAAEEEITTLRSKLVEIEKRVSR